MTAQRLAAEESSRKINVTNVTRNEQQMETPVRQPFIQHDRYHSNSNINSSNEYSNRTATTTVISSNIDNFVNASRSFFNVQQHQSNGNGQNIFQYNIGNANYPHEFDRQTSKTSNPSEVDKVENPVNVNIWGRKALEDMHRLDKLSIKTGFRFGSSNSHFQPPLPLAYLYDKDGGGEGEGGEGGGGEGGVTRSRSNSNDSVSPVNCCWMGMAESLIDEGTPPPTIDGDDGSSPFSPCSPSSLCSPWSYASFDQVTAPSTNYKTSSSCLVGSI